MLLIKQLSFILQLKVQQLLELILKTLHLNILVVHMFGVVILLELVLTVLALFNKYLNYMVSHYQEFQKNKLNLVLQLVQAIKKSVTLYSMQIVMELLTTLLYILEITKLFTRLVQKQVLK